MTTFVSGDLPAAVLAALDEVESELTTVEAALDPAELALADDVGRSLRQVHDPLTRALLDRPEILDWCLHRALGRAAPVPHGPAASTRDTAGGAEPPRSGRASSGRRKGTAS